MKSFSMEKQSSTKNLNIMNQYDFPWENIQFSQKADIWAQTAFFRENCGILSLHQSEKHFLISFVDPIIPEFFAWIS